MSKNTVRHQIKKTVFKGNAREAILNQLKDGRWYTLKELAFVAGITEAGASARVRDLRKPQYGGFTIDVVHGYGNTWLYRLAS